MSRPRVQGAVVFLTGLSGAGKSTIAQTLSNRLSAAGRTVTLLDGDNVRTFLTADLGFSASDRIANIARVAFVAAEVSRHGGIGVCACIAPYEAARQLARQTVEAAGGQFVLVHISTPLAVCEARDPKGLYARARAGLLSHFTGIDDPYEVPVKPDVAIDSTEVSPEEAASRILVRLAARGCLEISQELRL
jgi:sulfate adenylyltransferase